MKVVCYSVMLVVPAPVLLVQFSNQKEEEEEEEEEEEPHGPIKIQCIGKEPLIDWSFTCTT
ncbi:hypothetical protein PanWU01x14_122640 [Parasponia andersonii]|uniref:Uncharacterized protein n=1 Tax=Parasponia andersonii TaxID=3476 RepID=A0A2P5CUQ3_PARAD|nr:hypothetical protein PanWU01x14_122640 [Parasponia andersonii]